MARTMSLTLLTALFSTLVTAQIQGAGAPGNQNGTFGNPLLCRPGAGAPNATGSVTIAPALIQGGRADGNLSFNPVTWTNTIYQPSNPPDGAARTELSLWFNTNGGNYSDNYALGWDACYFWLAPFTLNTFYRGQNDRGGCVQTLDEDCVNDLKNAGSAQARMLTSNPTPGPNSNLTEDSLPGVCEMIAAGVTQNFPASCKKYFGEGPALFGGSPAIGGALTGPDSLVAETVCNTKYGSLMWTQYAGADLSSYTIASWWVLGIMTVFMPIADYERPVTLPLPVSQMSCFRANNISPGSTQVSDLPLQPSTPLDTSQLGNIANSSSPGNTTSTSSAYPVPTAMKMISVGAIVGIIIGVVAVIALIVGAIFFIRRRRARSAGFLPRDMRTSQGDHSDLLDRNGSVEAPHMNIVYEMAAPKQMMELQGRSKPAAVELPAETMYPPQYQASLR